MNAPGQGLTGGPPDSGPVIPPPPKRPWDLRPEGWDSAAPGYQVGLARLMDPFAADLVDDAQLALGMNVVDVAAGPGTVCFRAADRVGRGGRVEATDFSPRMVELLRAEAARRGWADRILARLGDGQTLEGLPDATFDRVLCQFGLIFFPDPLSGVRAAHRVLRPGGMLVASAWAPMDRNPGLTVFGRSVERHTPPKAGRKPPTFNLSGDGELAGLLAHAGFADVSERRVRHAWTAPAPAVYRDLIVEGSPAVRGFLQEADPGLRAAVQATFLELLRQEFGDGPVRFDCEARIVRGRK